MSNLIGNLLTNANALNAHSLGANTAGQNIANVNDPSYARQRVTLRDGGNLLSGSSLQSLGLEALGIEHIRNEILDKQIMTENMKRSFQETRSDLLKDLETTINDIIDREALVDTLDGNKSENLDNGGIAAALDELLTGFAELASAPENDSIKEVIFQRAEILIDQFQQAESRLEDLNEFVASKVNSDVDQANSLLLKIADLNSKIARTEIQKGMVAADLRDERQESIEALAEFIDFDTETSGINPKMVDIKVRTATTTGSEAFTKIVTGGNANGEFYFKELGNDTPQTEVNQMIFRTLGTASTEDKVLDLKGGSIHASLTVKDVDIVKLGADFDTLASALVSEVNTAYQGNPADATNAFFDATGITAKSIALDDSLFSTQTINNETFTFLDVDKLKTSNDTGGGNELAQAIGELLDKKVIGVDTSVQNSGFRFREFIGNVSARVGADAEATDIELENQRVIDDYLRSQRESHSGVSIDEEMTDLLRFQRSFQGTSRVISVLDNMLQEVVSGLVR